jgi:hypothetical protein
MSLQSLRIYIFYTAEANSFPTWSIILLNTISNYLLYNMINIFLYISITM